ncbi:hypothetical protein MKR66_07285 [Acinetobacter baumannii]
MLFVQEKEKSVCTVVIVALDSLFLFWTVAYQWFCFLFGLLCFHLPRLLHTVWICFSSTTFDSLQALLLFVGLELQHMPPGHLEVILESIWLTSPKPLLWSAVVYSFIALIIYCVPGLQ